MRVSSRAAVLICLAAVWAPAAPARALDRNDVIADASLAVPTDRDASRHSHPALGFGAAVEIPAFGALPSEATAVDRGPHPALLTSLGLVGLALYGRRRPSVQRREPAPMTEMRLQTPIAPRARSFFPPLLT